MEFFSLGKLTLLPSSGLKANNNPKPRQICENVATILASVYISVSLYINVLTLSDSFRVEIVYVALRKTSSSLLL